MDHPIRIAARELDRALKTVADVNPTFMSTADKAAALVELTALESRVRELRLRVAADAGDVAEVSGARDVAAWSAATTRRRRGDCAAEARLAAALAARPVLAAAVREGAVHQEQAAAIATSLDELPADLDDTVLAQVEEVLIGHAADFDPSQLRRLGRRVLDVVAPEIAEAAEARLLADLGASAQRRMRLSLRANGDGTTRILGLIPDAAAARLATYLHAFTNPRRETPQTLTGQMSTGQTSAGQTSSEPRAPYGRRAAAAFCQLLEALDPTRLPIHGGDATTLVVTVSLESLQTQLATATVGAPAGGVAGDAHDRITAAEARRLACTARIVPAVLGSDSEPLDLGRTTRLFTKAQRRALTVRDHQCRAEGCQIPAPWCEAHHADPWSHGGPTDLANAVLLCSHHHHRAHDPAYSVDRLPNGALRFHRRT